MKLELLSASNFLVHLVRLARRNVPESQLQKFHECLIEVLRRRYRDHWFPEKPFKGSGFRCIRINGKFDQLIGELTLWIDPLEVSYRIGENGSICVLYEHKDGVTEPWRPTHLPHNSKPTSTSSSSSTQNNNRNRGVIVGSDVVVGSPANCKDSLALSGLILDGKSVSIEQLAAFVSS